MILQKIISISGILLIMFIVWLMSENRKVFPFRLVLWGIGLQMIFAFIVFYLPAGIAVFQWIGSAITVFLHTGMKSATSVFGNILNNEYREIFGFQLGLIIMVTIVFFSSIVSFAYHIGIMQRFVWAMAWIMEKTMKTSGVESLSGAANVFIGQTEAPLMVRHYLSSASRSEINSIMVCGFATIAGGVMAAFIQMGISANLLISASILSVPGGLLLSKIVVPQDKKVLSLNELKSVTTPTYKNSFEALTQGAGDGMKLAINIIAMLIAFIAIITLINAGLAYVSESLLPYGITFFPVSLEQIFGFIFQPFAYLMGIPAEEAQKFGILFGKKTTLNEFLAFADLSAMIKNGEISTRTAQLSTFALCGFANFGSIAMIIGGLGGLVPEKKTELASLGLKAMFTAALVNIMNALIASLFI